MYVVLSRATKGLTIAPVFGSSLRYAAVFDTRMQLTYIKATPPIAFLAEKYWSRRTPMIISLVLLIGSQIMFMEANMVWLMCLARVLQGVRYARPYTKLFLS